MKKIIKVPEYFKDLPDDAYMESSEFSKLIGYKSKRSLTDACLKGLIPSPDSIRHTSRGKYNKSFYWKVKTIREWIENVNRNIPK